MGRYTGPKHKLARREGVNILDKTSASLQRRLSILPGVHGKKRRRPLSEFGQQLREKQKAKEMYGITERQFKNIVQRVQKRKGETGGMILAFLETRLDNVVYRLGFARSRFMSRQLVNHGHILVNGKKVTIPSYSVQEGDIISLSLLMQKNQTVLKALEEQKLILPFLQREAMVGKLVEMPKPDNVEVPFNIQLIVEYYSR